VSRIYRMPTVEIGSRRRASDKVDDSWTPPKDFASAPAHMTSRPADAPPSFKLIHDKFMQEVLGRTTSRTFRPAAMGGSKGQLGTRIADHYDAETDTIYEMNTTPWESMTIDQLKRKLGQVGSDFDLLHGDPSKPDQHVSNVVWIGDHPLPDTGLGGQLKKALEQAGIPYMVRDRTPLAGH
jgi:hypothetical protein